MVAILKAKPKARRKVAPKTIIDRDTSSTGHIRLSGNGKKILDIGATPSDMLAFALDFPKWFARLKPGPFELTITGNVDELPARKPAAKKPSSKD
jgi:hypothetical protein